MAATIPTSTNEYTAPPAPSKSGVGGFSLENVKNIVPGITAGMIKGNTLDLAGLPVDMINEVLKVVGLGTSRPVGGADSLRDLAGVKPQSQDNPAEVGGSFLSPAGAAKAMIVGAGRVLKSQGHADEAIGKILQTARDAQAMEMNGIKADVFKTTGVFTKSSDPVARAVISDASAKIKPGAIAEVWRPGENAFVAHPARVKQLSDILQHDELFTLYPELKDIKVRTVGDVGEATFYEKNRVMEIGPQANEKEYLSTLLHETQHAVQGVEDMARGGSQTEFAKYNVYGPDSVKNLRSIRQKAESDPDPTIREAARKTLAKINADLREAYQKYLDIPGEVEARFTQHNVTKSKAELSDKISTFLINDTPGNLWDR